MNDDDMTDEEYEMKQERLEHDNVPKLIHNLQLDYQTQSSDRFRETIKNFFNEMNGRDKTFSYER